MAGRGKRYTEASKLVDHEKRYSAEEAFGILAKMKKAKFDETVNLAVRLGVDPKHADQMVRGSVSLPHGTGMQVRVAVITKGEKEKEAREAGADVIGAEDLIAKITEGWLEFDKLIATPDMMGGVGKLGKILGPRGLMPNPKTGTVTFEVAKAVKDIKARKVDYRVDKAGNIHSVIGKASFEPKKLAENLQVIMDSILKAKPSTSKGQYIKSVTVSSAMGPGIRLDAARIQPS